MSDTGRGSRRETRREAELRSADSLNHSLRKVLWALPAFLVTLAALLRFGTPDERRQTVKIFGAEFAVLIPALLWFLEDTRRRRFRRRQLDRADDQLDLADAQLARAADLQTAVTEMDRQTTRLQRVAIIVGIVTGLLGAMLGGFAGAWAATVLR